MNIQEQEQILKAKFSEDQLEKTYDGFTYIKFCFVEDRLDQAFGIDGWGYDWSVVGQHGEDLMLAVTLSVTFCNGSVKTVKSIGSAKVTNKRMSAENLYKACVSSGLKKCAMSLGVGRYLAYGEKDESVPNYVTGEPSEIYNYQQQPANNFNSYNKRPPNYNNNGKSNRTFVIAPPRF